MKRFGIYGYECTSKATLDRYTIVPVSKDYTEVAKLSSDPNSYHLTAFLEMDIANVNDTRQLLYDLEGVLSFIDYRDVVVTNELHESESCDKLEKDYPKVLNWHNRHNGGGQMIRSDAFASGVREQFIKLAMHKLADNTDPINSTFRSAFFKTIEVFRSRINYLDISFYLQFSALESLCREVMKDYQPSCAVPIYSLLKEYGFNVLQNNPTKPSQLSRTISTYAQLRNALFHNGKFESEVTVGGKKMIIKLSSYHSQFERLVPLVMMKYIGFDDGHINWNSWLDRMPFS